MSVDTTQPQRQDPPTTTADQMLDTVRRRLIAIHYGLVDSTGDDKDAKGWAQRELMALIRELTPYRQTRTDTTDTG
jgi:hypothetical protein